MYRNPRLFIPLLFGVIVALLFVFASFTAAITFAVIGGVAIGCGFVYVALRSRI